MPIEAYEELQAIREQKKQSPPTPPPTPDNTQTGAFGDKPVVTGTNKAGFPKEYPINQFPETGDPNIPVDWFNSQRTVNALTGEINIPPESITAPTPAVKFWLDLGAPQYIRRYAPFEIPSGYKVSSMVEQNNQLKIMFVSTRPSIGNPATLMKTWEAFALQAQQDAVAPSREASPILMKNLEKLYGEGPQNLLDLQAKEFAESDYGKLLESSPGAKRMYESALLGGRPAPTFTLWTTTMVEKKPTLKEAYQQYHDVRTYEDFLALSPGAKRMYESAISGGRPPPAFTLWTITTKQDTARLIAESEAFYTSIGYSQFGGKYAPFLVPEGAKIQDITATPQGLQVTFKYLPQTQTQTAIIGKSPLNVGQTVTIQRQPLPEVIPSLTGWLLGQSKEAAKYERIMGPSPLTSSKRFETLAGFVASGESLINPRTPFVVSPAFIGGYIFGAVVTGYGIGKAVQPIVQPLTQALVSPVQSKASVWLTKSYEESVRAGELWKPSLTERIVMGVTGTTPKELPRSVIGLPTLIEEAPAKVATSNRLDVRGLQATLGLGPEEAKQLPSLIAGEDIFEFTNAPRTVGFGYTVPLPEATKTVAAASLETFGLPAPALSSIVAKWFTPIDHGVMPKQELGFSKQPQTYRPAEESALSFSKQYGAFPTQSGLLEQIVRQEAKAIAVSRGMPNVFGPAVTTVQKTASPFIVANLGEMTSWLLRQETRAKTMESAITPLSISFQPQPRTKQIDETQYLTYPGQPLTVNVPTRETTKTSIIDLGVENVLLGKQKEGTVQSLPLLEKQVYQTTQPQISLASQRLFQTPTVETETQTKTKVINLPIIYDPLKLDEYTIQTPHITPIIPLVFRQDYIPPTPRIVPDIPGTIPVPPKLFDLPKGGGGGLGPKQQDNIFYPFGRQKRKYPVMTGQQVAKFLFSGKNETKRRKKK